MCTTNAGIKFCTCSNKESGADKPNETIAAYKWRLTRFRGLDDSGKMGSIIGPSQDLGHGLTAEAVLKVLNAGNCFDFDYSPEVNDSLQLSRSANKSDYAYMSFLYDGMQWVQGMNPPFTTISEELGKGGISKGS
jgi:hypothetical protein